MKNDKYLTDKELLHIYGINHPNVNLGDKTNQRSALIKMKYGSDSKYEHIIKNPYVRWTLIILFVLVASYFGAWLFTEYTDGLFSWQRTLN